jgi:hypothetical protein
VAPPNRRTAKALRSGCELCSKNVSAKAVALFHELRTQLPYLELEAPILLDPAPGVRYRGTRVDMWEEALHLVVEFDGWKTHGPAGWRDRTAQDLAKTQRLQTAGERVIRVREDLDPLGAHDVAVGSGWNAWKVALAVLRRVKELGIAPLEQLDAYAARGTEAAAADTARALLGERYQPRAFPKKEKPAAEPRQNIATEPHPDSWLTPTGAPYPNPTYRAGALRDYQCRCGNRVIGAVQADVTRGNKKSCGCLGRESRTMPRGRTDRELTQAARHWAAGEGIVVSSNGALEARVLASYQLHAASLGSVLGPDHLIVEETVRVWAAQQQVQLRARGRLPSSAWKQYAAFRIREQGRPEPSPTT